MKTNKNKKHLSAKKKTLLFNSGLFLALFGITAGTTYLMIPKKGMAEDEDIVDVDDDDDEVILTGKQRFIENLTGSATSGLSLKFNTLDAYFPGKDKEDTSKGNKIDGSGSEIAFAMDGGISLHGISLGLKAKLDYNGYKRQLSLAKHAEDIYFAINDLDNETYSFKYKASIEPKVTGDRDPITQGIIQYEYGDVDWIISDVLEILSNGGIKVDFPSIDLSSLSSSSTSSSSSDEDGSNAMSNILGSLNDMVEDTAHSYFTWNLPLGEETLSIGFTYDSDYYLSGIDFPAKTFDGADQTSYSIKNGDTLIGTIRASATVETGSQAVSWLSFIPGEKSEYLDIVNSASLFKKVARYIANPQFGLKTTNSLNVNSGNGLALTHYKKDGESVTSEVIETASLNLSACADFTGGLQNFLADISLSADNAEAKISAAYLEDSAYLNVDNLLMAKVS